MLDGIPFKPIKEINLLCNKGGMGDSIARMPAVKWVLDNCLHIGRVNLIVQDYFIEVAEELIKDHRLSCFGYSQMEEVLKNDAPGMMVDSLHHTTMRTHLTDHAFHTLVDISPTVEEKQYLKFKFSQLEPKKQVVLTTGFTSATREWNSEVTNEVAKYCLSRGYEVIFLGSYNSVFWESKKGNTPTLFKEGVDYSLGTDLRDKTSIIEAAKIIAESSAIVGLDNGLLHLAACTSTPIVAGFTTVNPKHRIPYTKQRVEIVEPDAELVPCRYCQTKMSFVYNFDLRMCYTNTYKCIKMQRAEPYIKGLQYVGIK